MSDTASPHGGPRGAEVRQRELLAWARGRLAGLEASDPAQEARVLLEWALGVDSLWGAPDLVGAHAAERFRSAVAQRRAHVPLQHVTGRMWFRGLELLAREGVFVVRPETEVVAGAAIDAARSLGPTAPPDEGGGPVLVDLCTGSGAIAVSLAHEVEGARVLAVEIDEDACALARDNVARCEAAGLLAPGSVEVVRDDAMRALGEWEGKADVVVSNPPYVPGADAPTQAEALQDPPTALFGGGEDGLVVPRGIVHRAAALLRPGGILVVEHAESQASTMRAVACGEGFTQVRTGCDLAGRDRMLLARRAPRDAVTRGGAADVGQ